MAELEAAVLALNLGRALAGHGLDRRASLVIRTYVCTRRGDADRFRGSRAEGWLPRASVIGSPAVARASHASRLAGWRSSTSGEASMLCADGRPVHAAGYPDDGGARVRGAGRTACGAREHVRRLF